MTGELANNRVFDTVSFMRAESTLRPIAVLVILGVTAGPMPAAAGEPGGPSPDCRPCQKRYSVPFVHIGLLELGMHTAEGVLWPDGFSPIQVRKNARRLAESWTRPPEFGFSGSLFSSDGDWWTFNIFAHGLFGSEAYLSGRVWGHRPVVAGLLTLFASFTWEYLVEGWYQRPSAIDLFWTPLSGALLGELRYRALRALRRLSRPELRRAMGIVLDPLGSLERRILECPPP